MKLAVCYPWASPFMFTGFVDSTLNMKHPDGFDVKFFRGAGWCPAKRHMTMCEEAMSWGADLICIIGADQVHPEDMLIRLTDRWNQGYEIITLLVPARGYVSWQPMKPFQPMAYRFKTNTELGEANLEDVTYRNYEGMDKSGHLLHVVTRADADENGMARCNFIGSGVLMFEKAHLAAITKPWFYETFEKETQTRRACMDSKFIWRLQEEAGATIWVDTTIFIKHLHVFEIDDSFSDRFSDWTDITMADLAICNFRPEEHR